MRLGGTEYNFDQENIFKIHMQKLCNNNEDFAIEDMSQRVKL